MSIPKEVIDAFDAVVPGHGPIEKSDYYPDDGSCGVVWPKYTTTINGINVGIRHAVTRNNVWYPSQTYIYCEKSSNPYDAVCKEMYLLRILSKRILDSANESIKVVQSELEYKTSQAREYALKLSTISALTAGIPVPSEFKKFQSLRSNHETP